MLKYYTWRILGESESEASIASKRFTTAEKAMEDAELVLKSSGSDVSVIEILELVYVVKKGPVPIEREFVYTPVEEYEVPPNA